MDTLERYAPNENLTRDEAAWRAANIVWHSADVFLDLGNATDAGQEGYLSSTTLRFSSGSTQTFIDFIHGGVDEIQVNGRMVAVDGAVLDSRIYLSDLQTTAVNTVVIAGRALYSRSGEGLHRFLDPQDQQTYLYTQFEPADARRVFACFEQPDLKTSYRFTVRGPESWHLASNQPAESQHIHEDGTKTVTFAPTPPISSYITSVLAGPYHVVRDEHSLTLKDGSELRIELAASCRAALAKDFDAEQILKVTKQGLSYFHELFDYPYPWGKYDSAFVPEYNLGAMENPGLVTFTERYVFTSHATEAQHEQRANTIMHEMAHMWFGDLVTMKWWDDLWLKESFADYIGTLANDVATDFTTAWTTFAARRKAWAYVADQMPTTHPIVADITDLQAADQNFDGITYAKGASVLKQLAAFVGAQAFRDAARSYFQKHEYGNTSLGDFLAALEEASGRDMGAWADAWLRTSGVPRLGIELAADQQGLVTSAALVQRGTDPLTGEGILRPHVLTVAGYDLREGRLVRTRGERVELIGERVALDFLVGTPAPDLLLPNDGDETYAVIEFDERSLRTLLQHLGSLTDSLPRATCWASLWDAVRGGRLATQHYVDAVLSHASTVQDAGVYAVLVDQLLNSVNRYLAPELRPTARQRAAEALTGWLGELEAGSDNQTTTARALARLARSGVAVEVVDSFLAPQPNPHRVNVDEQLLWLSWEAVAAARGLDETAQVRMHAALQENPTTIAQNAVRTARAARPEHAVKAKAFEEVFSARDDDGELSNDALSAIAEGFGMGSRELLAGFEETYWTRILQVFESMSMEFSTRIIRGLFPRNQDLSDTPQHNPALRAVTEWLEEHGTAPRALRRILIEEKAELERSLEAQQVSRRASGV
ncbi:aminopeptidase N [Glutamicibacter sp. MNS18]|uniref:aminopeptidase N n=1 Tax=Glutamicibacter sp. MNS18 TaxID=2989817 RepID=UPI002235E670|nr:aminopeptidase N [Glutamicibacter sp. MNS18]MCW4464932.1 aminopeptidase N [Glutamicibacter sp. MNS18]